MRTSCFHCQNEITGIPFQSQPANDGGVKNFCCRTCLTIWELITEKSLEEFYDYRDTGKIVSPEKLKRGFTDYDSESLISEFVKTDNEVSSASFLLEGITCTACAWLVEKVIQNLEGVTEVRITYHNSLAAVKWRAGKTGLGKIVTEFRRFGFNARPYTPSAELKDMSKNNLSLLFRLGVSGFAAGNIMLFYIAIYSGMFYGMEERIRLLFEWGSLVLATPAIFFSAAPLTDSVITGIRLKKVNMDFPVVLALFTTYIYSIFAIFNHYDPYFDTLAIFLFFILLGRYIQGSMLLKSLAVSDSLKQLKVSSARVLENGSYSFTPVKEIKTGTIIKVLEGERIPLDGIVHKNQPVTIDESMLTGEASPVYKDIGSPVLSGTSLSEGELVYRTTRQEGENRIDRIAALLASKDQSFSGFISLSDRAASWFTISIMLVSAGTGIFLFFDGAENPFWTALSVLIVTCPCAMGLSIPMAQIAANRSAYSSGILVKSFDAYEIFSRVTHLVLDKTGTITQGLLEIDKIEMVDKSFSENMMLELVYPLQKESRHPVGHAFLKRVQKSPFAASGVVRVPGMGVSGFVDGKRVMVGNRKIFKKNGIPLPDSIQGNGESSSVVYCSCGEKIIAKVTMSDTLKPDLEELSSYLHLKNITVSVLTGDSERASERAASALGATHLKAGLLPAEKMQFIEKAKGRAGTVVMVGDGFNDTPAFSEADLSVALNTTLDSPLEAADVILLNNDIVSLKYFHLLSIRCMRIIKQNLGLSVFYNALALPLAVSGHISPIIAAILMPLSSITVLLNSKRVMESK